MDANSKYTLAELAQLAGVRPRTIRYYVQRGIIPPPAGKGRGAHYAEEHLQLLLRARTEQSEGKSLDEIKHQRSGDSTEQAEEKHAMPRRSIIRIRLTEGIWLEVSKGAEMPRPPTLQKMAELCRRQTKRPPQEEKQRTFLVQNCKPGPTLIPHGGGPNQTLRLGGLERIELEELNPALKEAQLQGLITINEQ